MRFCKLWELIALPVVLLVVAGCVAVNPAPTASRPDMSSLAFAIESKVRAGGPRFKTVQAVLVSKDGKTVAAEYANGRTANDALHVWSVSKSVASALVGIAIGDGLIDGLDANLGELLPEYAKDMGPDVASVQLRQLMDMTGGFRGDEPNDAIVRVFAEQQDPIPLMLREGHIRPAGESWEYSGVSAHLVTAVLRSALQRDSRRQSQSVLAYAREKLFDPLGIDSDGAWSQPMTLPPPLSYPNDRRFGWGSDAAGLNSGCCLLHIRPADMLKLGELYLGDGVWHGKRILPEGWVEQSTTPGRLSGEYGLMWYRISVGGREAYAAQGRAGQLVAVFPDLQVVVAIASVETAEGLMTYEDPWSIVTDVILPAVS